MSDNKSIFADMYSRIEEIVFFGDNLASRQLLALASPGQFLDPVLDENNDDDLANQSSIGNTILDASFVYSPLIGSLSQKYWDIVDSAEVPQRQLSRDEEKEVKDISDWMKKHRDDYMKYGDLYFTAANTYERIIRDPAATSAEKNRALQNQNTALADWNNEQFGAKGLWDRRAARLLFLTSRDPNVYWNELRNDKESPLFKRLTSRGEVFYPSYMYPTFAQIATTTQWSHAKIVASDHSSSYQSESTSWSGGVGISFGLWSIGGGGGGHDVDTHVATDGSDITVEFDYMRVRVRRPWLRDAIFSMRSWKWDGRIHANEKLSDGGNMSAHPRVRPIGTMPLLTTEMLVVKNVRISGNWGRGDDRFHESVRSGSASVGFACFRISGSYEHRSVRHDVKGQSESGVLKIDAPQIIGYFSTVLPECPNPDPSLSWTSPALAGNGFGEQYATARLLRATSDAAAHAADTAIEDRVAQLNSMHSKLLDAVRRDRDLQAQGLYQKALMDLLEREPERYSKFVDGRVLQPQS